MTAGSARATRTRPGSAIGSSIKQKFPNGMKTLISKVNGLGMKFGLWFEPEMVNPDSDLYRAHPDWAMNFPGRPRSEARNQLVLNMARDDVKEYIVRRARQDARGEQHRVHQVGHEPALRRARHGQRPDRPAEGDLGQVREERLRDLRPAARQVSQARDRVVLGRRRAHRPRHPEAGGRGLDVGQHRGVRPAADSGRLHAWPIRPRS